MQQVHTDCHRKLYRTKLRSLPGLLVGSREVEVARALLFTTGEAEAGAYYCLGKGCKVIKWPESDKLGLWSLVSPEKVNLC